MGISFFNGAVLYYYHFFSFCNNYAANVKVIMKLGKGKVTWWESIMSLAISCAKIVAYNFSFFYEDYYESMGNMNAYNALKDLNVVIDLNDWVVKRSVESTVSRDGGVIDVEQCQCFLCAYGGRVYQGHCRYLVRTFLASQILRNDVR